MKLFIRLMSIGFILILTNCASPFYTNLEDARFALDNGNYDSAISKATAAVSASPNDVEANRILASSYFARSGLDFLELAGGIIDLDDGANSKLRQVADILPATATMADVRSAITSLQALSGITGTSLTGDIADAAFDLGLMQTVEQFALGVYGSNYKTTLDASLVTETQATQVQADLIAFDNRLTGSGVDSSESYITDVRQTFCILEPLSTGEGFTTSEYRAFVGCQLTESPGSFDTTVLDAAIANCEVIDPDTQGTAVRACYNTNTSL